MIPWAYHRREILAFASGHWKQKRHPQRPPKLDLCVLGF